jgi:hypothetical protein
MFRRPAFPSVPLKVICELVEYLGCFRVANFGGEAATFCLYYLQAFLVLWHGAKHLKRVAAQNY